MVECTVQLIHVQQVTRDALIFILHCIFLQTDSAYAQGMCDAGSDHYCSITCNRCSDSQNIIMLVGGFRRSPSKQWMLNPTFFSLNGSLPTCLASIKNNISMDSSHNKIKSPALFTNQGDILQQLVIQKLCHE